MREGDDEHTGVVASVGLDGFADGRVLGHEGVQATRVESLVRHYDRVAMRSELVALFHRAEPGVTELTDQICQQPALLEFIDAGGVEQWIWRAHPEESAALIAAPRQAPALHRGRSSPSRRRSPPLGT